MKKPQIFADFTAAIACAVALFSFAVPVEIFAEKSAENHSVPAEIAESVPAEISENSLVLGRQDFGETRIDCAISGNAFKIAGATFPRGIGASASSMIPLDVPAGATEFSGAVGIDDSALSANPGVPAAAEFRVLGGSEIFWNSGKIGAGERAKSFSVKIPAGTRKLYLFAARAGDSDFSVPANWVNLAWKFAPANSVPANAENSADFPVFSAAEFGILPNVSADQTANFRKALAALRSRGGTLELPRGEYHFFAQNAHEMTFWISNHDQQETHRIALPLVDLRNVKIRGNGSAFIFHGLCIATLFMDCENVSLEGVQIDFARPLYSEAKVLGFERGKTLVAIDRAAFPYEIRDGRLVFVGENFPPQTVQSAIAFRNGSKNIVANTSDIPCGNAVEERADGTLALAHDFSRDGDGVRVGDTLTLRTWWRPAPACVIYRAENTALRDVSIHSSFGMTLLAQRSENITFAGTRDAAAKTAGMFPRAATGRVYSASADATHFSNVKGLVVVENAFFETMMDDAINVHSTSLDIAEIVAPDTLRCRYRHPQAIGFEIFLPGETLRFIAGPTLENGASAKVKSVRRISPTEALITLDGRVPAEIRVGDAVENADFQPEVIFRGNIVQNNRARGALFTTPRRVLVENNIFRNVAGSAILLAGDAQGWYESGACADVAIRGNVFENNLTSRFQFTEAVISIYPEVSDLAAQTRFYHKNIAIEGNIFRTFDVPLLFAISAEKIRFANNRIFRNRDFAGWERKPFAFRRCADVEIRGNAVAAVGQKTLKKQNWTLADAELELTPPSEIRF